MGSNPILRKEFVRSLKTNPTALAQLVEHRAFNPIAKGSSPLRGTRVDELSKIITLTGLAQLVERRPFNLRMSAECRGFKPRNR